MSQSPSSPATPPLRHEVVKLAGRAHCQVLVIGGGINGIAVFRDLALQGIDVVLVERGDYCSGASAASSHMIHGGIRYLENGEFRLVRESVKERNWLLKAAPHYVKPLQTTVPIFSTVSGLFSAPVRFLTHRSGRPSERGALLIKIGLTIYDFFSRDGGSVPRHRFRGRSQSLAALPSLDRRVKYTATYFDASVHDPERLALDVLQDGLSAGSHARSANYVEAIRATSAGVVVRDRESAFEFLMAPDLVINTSGPWTDMTNIALGAPTSFMGGTKGSHIVVDNPVLAAACAGGEVFFESRDGRIVLIFPLKGKVMIGTTDLDADINAPSRCTEAEVDYFIDLVAQVFPHIRVDRSQIVFRFSGVRPLPKHDDLRPGFVSRDYRIESGTYAGGPLLSLVGGKWTTFRALAATLSARACTVLGLTRTVDTTHKQIGGGVGYPITADDRTHWLDNNGAAEVGLSRATELLSRYGTRAAHFISTIATEPDRPLKHCASYSERELAHIIATEHVVHLDDIVLRRTSIAFTGETTPETLAEVATIAAPILGWSTNQSTDEVLRTQQILANEHGGGENPEFL